MEADRLVARHFEHAESTINHVDFIAVDYLHTSEITSILSGETLGAHNYNARAIRQ